MSDLTAYRKSMRAKNKAEDDAVRRMCEEHAQMREWLKEFVTPPLALSGKRDLVESVRVYLEEWNEV
jgi:hypothetical protein